MSIEFLESDFDKVSYLVNLLTARATGLAADDHEFEVLRHELLSKSNLSSMLPSWLRQHRNLDSFGVSFSQNLRHTQKGEHSYLNNLLLF
ncbi:hypothetical protein [Aeromonas enteropelogenes]|uniref:hypothetical protein n=1 Tax=Aeromonas enteropelogenes TaxID=29489 RepID=UPI003F742C2A